MIRDDATMPDGRAVSHGRRWALTVAVAAMALTLLPYLFGYSLRGIRPGLDWFSWLGYNLDDSCVYLAWMRQAADGSPFQRNLFTTAPQAGRQINLFFLVLGNLSRFTHLSPLAVYHLSRLVLGVALLRAIWWLLETLLQEERARRAAFLFVCFSAGLGWLPGQWRDSGINSPIDVWQPESITFLCLYLSPLFLVSLLLMVGMIGWLLHGDRSGDRRCAVYAGLCGFVLGNIHTYDVITVTAVWGAYRLARIVADRRLDRAAWGRAIVAGLITLPSTAYTFYLIKTDPVFAKRVAVPTMSAPLMLHVLGYGLILALAVAAVCLAFRRQPRETAGDGAGFRDSIVFLVTWALMNFAVAFLPVSFQRKMLMGLHLPLAILAGVAVAMLLGRLQGWSWTFALAGAIAVTFPTNARFMWRDVRNFQHNKGQSQIQRPYMYDGEVRALQWIRDRGPAGAPIQPLPWVVVTDDRKIAFFDTTVACFAPGLTGHPVNAGHWGETPDFQNTMGAWRRFLLPSTQDTDRIALLRQTGVRYVLFTQKHDETGDPNTEQDTLALFRGTPPAYLRLVPEASNADADVYEVRLP